MRQLPTINVLDIDLQRRVQRLLAGERRIDDLDRTFLGLRDRSRGRASVLEIGDFVAHRNQREKGPVTQSVRDIFLGFHLWARICLGHRPNLQEVRSVSAANLRTATDEQLSTRLGLHRSVAKSVLEQTLRKIEQGKPATYREQRVINYLGGAFIWNPAFTDMQVAGDLQHVLSKTRLLPDASSQDFDRMTPFLTLYVLTLMHGSVVILGDGGRAELIAGFDNDHRRLEVKALLTFTDLPKPVFAPVCVFWTTLKASEYCATSLLNDPKGWSGPLEIDQNGKLAAVSE